MPTIEGIIVGPAGEFPLCGVISFTLVLAGSSAVDSEASILLPFSETFPIEDDGTFSADLNDTTSIQPAGASYAVSATAIFGSSTVTTDLGNISVSSAPSTQQLSDLLLGNPVTDPGAYNVSPTGNVDGINCIYKLPNAQIPSSEMIFVDNGQILVPGAYVIDAFGRFVTNQAPASRVRVWYKELELAVFAVNDIAGEVLTQVTPTTFSFNNQLELNTEMLFVGGVHQTPGAAGGYFIDNNGYANFSTSGAPASAPIAFYRKFGGSTQQLYNLKRQQFVGDGVTTLFVLEESIQVSAGELTFMDGYLQSNGIAYTVQSDHKTLQFVNPPNESQNITVYWPGA